MKPIVFQNYGGLYQLHIESAEDLAFIHQLHPARWAATTVQLESLQCDPAFLEYLNPVLRLGFSWTLDCERVLAGGVSR